MYLDERLTDFHKKVFIYEGKNHFDSNKHFIEIEISHEYQKELLKNGWSDFTNQVVLSIDTFYKQ